MTPIQYRAHREQLGLTQARLADILGIAREAVVRRESGKQPISEEMSIAIRSLNPENGKKGGRPRKPKAA